MLLHRESLAIALQILSILILSYSLPTLHLIFFLSSSYLSPLPSSSFLSLFSPSFSLSLQRFSYLIVPFLSRHCFLLSASSLCLSCFRTVLGSAPPFNPQNRSLCLTASKSSTAALTDTLSESRMPSIGMRMWASAALRQMSVRPVASVPITIAVPHLMSVS